MADDNVINGSLILSSSILRGALGAFNKLNHNYTVFGAKTQAGATSQFEMVFSDAFPCFAKEDNLMTSKAGYNAP